jgi:hypothetical protein
VSGVLCLVSNMLLCYVVFSFWPGQQGLMYCRPNCKEVEMRSEVQTVV